MKWSVLVAVVLVARFAAPPAQAQSQTVAEVGDGQEVTIGELNEYLEARPDLLYGLPREEAYRVALDDLVTKELKRIDLFASGLARDSAFVQGLKRSVAEELVLAYGKTQYEDRFLNEEKVQEEYGEMGRAVLYRQIILNKPSDASPALLDSLRATVRRIRQEIDDGVPFETLVQQYSEDNASAAVGGAATPLLWRQTLKNPRSYIIFHLAPGEVRSFEGARRFSIVHVERVEQVPVPPLDDVRDEIVRALNGWHAAEATRAFQNEWFGLVDTTALQWNTEALEQLVAWSNTPGFYEREYRATIQRHLADHGDAPVLTDGRGEVRLSDLPQLFDDVLTLGTSAGHDAEFIREFLLEAVRTQRLGERARALGLDDEIWQPDTPSSALASAFVRFYNWKRIEDRIPEPTETALRAFYEAHADSLFYQLARVHTEVIVRSDEGEVEALWEEVQQGVPFEEVSSRRLIRSFERTRDGEIVTRFNPEPPYLGEVAFGLEEGEVAGPVAYDDAEEGRLYAIVLATRQLEERQLAFDEVRDRVAEAFVEHHRARIAADVAEELREKYGVTVYENVLEERLAAE
jgi:hypothetical protein